MAGLVSLGLAYGGDRGTGSMAPSGFKLVGSFRNAGFLACMLLQSTVLFLLPLFACVVSGEMLAGEAADGTLRTVLSRPVGRSKLVTAKFIASALYVVALTLFTGAFAYALGSIFLGHGALCVANQRFSVGGPALCVYTEAGGLVRLLAAYAFASLAVLSVATIAFFISTLLSNSAAAIGGGMMAAIVFGIIQNIPYFKPVQPFLFTTHMGYGMGLLVTPIPWAEVCKSMGVLSAYVIAFFLAGLMIFRRKDVLS